MANKSNFHVGTIQNRLIEEAYIVEDIANEEYTHAEAMWKMLKKHGVDFSQHHTINHNWEKVKAIFNLE